MKLFFIALFSLLALSAGLGEARDGKEIVDRLNRNRNKCKEPSGGSWVPLPEGLTCGISDCKWPREWCVIKSKSGIPDLFCQPLDSTCQEAVTQGGKEEAKIITSAENSAEEEESEEQEETTTTTKATTTAADNESAKSSILCNDFHDVCCFWAASGECDRNPIWMKRGCRKSCGVCACSALNPETCPTRIDVGNCRWLVPFPIAQAVAPVVGAPRTQILITRPALPPGRQPPPAGNGARPPTRPNARCQDRQPLCHFWASTGQCGFNTAYMTANCPASCGFC